MPRDMSMNSTAAAPLIVLIVFTAPTGLITHPGRPNAVVDWNPPRYAATWYAIPPMQPDDEILIEYLPNTDDCLRASVIEARS